MAVIAITLARDTALKALEACGKPIAVPEGQLDQLVIGALADKLLTGDRLIELLRQAHAHRRNVTSGNLQRRAELTKRRKAVETKIGRFHTAIADGLVTDTDLFKRDLNALLAEREECIRLLSMLDVDAPQYRQALSRQQATSAAATLKRRLLDAPKPLQRRYVRGLVSDIVVNREKAVITGPQAAVAAAVTSGALEAEVRSSVREWRSHGESNPGFSLERAAS